MVTLVGLIPGLKCAKSLEAAKGAWYRVEHLLQGVWADFPTGSSTGNIHNRHIGIDGHEVVLDVHGLGGNESFLGSVLLDLQLPTQATIFERSSSKS